MYKILLADDEGIVIDSLKYIIEKEFGDACQIAFAKTGRSVIELAENFRPDIAIMDIQMPGINGIDAMKEMKASHSNTIFIVVSAYDKFDYAQKAINLGVLEYLNKPIDRNHIVSILKKAMQIIDKEREKRTQDLITREKMETVVPIIENGLIYSILFRENNNTDDIENFKHLLGLQENYGYMAVLVCGDNQEGTHMTNAAGASVRMQNQYREIREIVKEFFPSCSMGALMANKISLFLPAEDPKMEYNERIFLIEKSRELVRKLRQKMDIKFRMGIGGVKYLHHSMDSYNESLRALSHTTGSVAHVDDLPIGCDYEENYPIETEKQLFEKTQSGDLNGVIASANLFFDWMQENYSEYMTDIKLKVLEFVLWAEHLAYESGGMTYHFRSRQSYLPTLNQLEQLDDVRNWFIDRVSEACRNVVIKKEEQSNTIISRAKQYIDSHYSRDISLAEVSREVDISPYYFCKIFKEETGENYIEYLTNIRIEQAKELLMNTELSMKEICAKIGYSDPNYFSRAFKKKVGVTPTEYKEGR